MLILIDTGSEVSFCLTAWEQFTKEGIKVRVVSMPSWQLFDGRNQNYRDQVLPPAVSARVSVEEASVASGVDPEGTSFISRLYVPGDPGG